MTLLQDLRFACRILARERWFTLVAALALGLGIGVNATVFTFVNAVLVRGLPFEDAAEIVHLNSRHLVDGSDDRGVSLPDFQDWQSRARTFESLGAYTGGTMNVSDAGRPPERINGTWVTANTFTILRQRPLLGRDFRPEEDRKGAEPVVILGYTTWQTRYGGDPGILGRTIKINEVAATVVGVMPDGMKFPTNSEMWQPIAPDAAMERRDSRRLNAFGRLADGKRLGDAQTEMTGIAAALAQDHPETNKNIGVVVMTFNDRFNGGPIKLIFLVLMGAVGFVLLIACANVANLLLARSARRSREIAVRVALGAGRGRVIRQLLVESTLLALIGGLVGLGLSLVGVRLFDMAVADVGKPYWIRFTMDGTVFVFLLGVCIATGVLFGLAPALQVSKTNLNDVLKEGGRGTAGGVRARRLTSAMVIAEIALTLVLLVGAGLMVRSFLKLYALDLGIDTSRLVTMRLTLAERKYPTPEQRLAFYDALVPRLQALPGVRAATITTNVPLGGGETRSLEVDGRPAVDAAQLPRVSVVRIGASYFDAIGVTLPRGRAFTDTDGAKGSETVIVNERLVAQHFRGEDPIGRRIRMNLTEGESRAPWVTIVGVAPTLRQRNVQDAEPDAVAYLPYRATAPVGMAIVVRSHGDPAALIGAIRAAVQEVDPDQPVFNVQTMDQFLARNRWPFRVFGSMFSIFATIALLLSAVGIYAVTAYAVTQRTAEIGVRMALGARPRQVSWLILRQGIIQLVAGLGIGLPGAYGVGRLMQALLVQVRPVDPVTFTAVSVLLAAITVTACLVPAWRATRLDPLAALRVD